MAVHRDFKGIWIPKEIWLFKGLTVQEKVFLAEIDSLDNGAGCFAKNEHFSKVFGLSKNRCSEIVTKLREKGFLTVQIEDNNVRKLRLLTGFDISTEGSTSRQKGSTSRQEGSISRHPIYKDIEIQLEIQESDARAFDYFFKNYPSRCEQWLMKYKSTIKDFKKFILDFNDKYDEEGKDYDVKKIEARLSRFARNWAEVERKNVKGNPQSQTALSKITLK